MYNCRYKTDTSDDTYIYADTYILLLTTSPDTQVDVCRPPAKEKGNNCQEKHGEGFPVLFGPTQLVLVYLPNHEGVAGGDDDGWEDENCDGSDPDPSAAEEGERAGCEVSDGGTVPSRCKGNCLDENCSTYVFSVTKYYTK